VVRSGNPPVTPSTGGRNDGAIILGIVAGYVGRLLMHNEMFDLGGLVGAIVGVMILLALYRAVLKDKEHPLAR
jgi:hypothetical protein